MNSESQRILVAASEFLWSEETQASLDAFSTNFASMFEGCVSGQEEQRLEWGEAHKDFQQLFELHMEQFVSVVPAHAHRDVPVPLKLTLCLLLQLEQRQIPAEDFVAACQDALDHGSWEGGCKGLVEVVLSMSTYEYFIQMMIAASEPDPFDRSFSTRLDAFDDPEEEGGHAGGGDPLAADDEQGDEIDFM